MPVVASDTDSRPEGVIKFAIGDGQQLVSVLLQVLSRLSQGSRRIPGPPKPSGSSCAETMLGMYKSLCNIGNT